MLNEPDKQSENEPVEVRCYFVRERNALLVRAQFTPLFTDYYLHLMQHKIRYEGESDLLLKNTLSALTLHLASRPWGEAAAWTLNFQDPLINVFATGSNRSGTLTGRVFDESVKKADKQTFHAQITEDGGSLRKSVIEIKGLDAFRAVEEFYKQSEQRRARIFELEEEDLVMITAQPQCDMEWFDALDLEAVKNIDQSETLSLLEKRVYRFDCGCSEEKFFNRLENLTPDDVDHVFSKEGFAEVICPRCGAKVILSREHFAAYISKIDNEKEEQ